MVRQKLYGKDSKGGLKLWEVSTDGCIITVRHGKVGGTIQSKTTVTTPKNEGRTNASTAEEQANIEALAKVVKQKKRGYYETKEEALEFVDTMPMKAQNYNDHSGKITFPCYVQPKLNGQRLVIGSDGKAQSKQGEPIEFPSHWLDSIEKLKTLGMLDDGLDGEIFAGYQAHGGLSLQRIVSAFRKPNEDTEKLYFAVYDTTSSYGFGERAYTVNYLVENPMSNIVGVETVLVHSQEEANALYEKWVAEGAEGMVYRMLGVGYEFGKRSYNLIKRKPRQDAEAVVISVAPDKNNSGILSCQLENGVTFKCLMRVDSHPTIDYRKYDNAINLVGGFIKFEYEELSDSGVPTKPVGVSLCEVNNHWESLV